MVKPPCLIRDDTGDARVTGRWNPPTPAAVARTKPQTGRGAAATDGCPPSDSHSTGEQLQ